MLAFLLTAASGLGVGSGCSKEGLRIRDAFKAMKKDPNRETTKAFLALGHEAVKYLETLPQKEKRVKVTTEDVVRGHIAKGAQEGFLNIHPGNPPFRGTLAIPVEMIREIAFPEE
jgi:hypothetical protein